nr:hypothetical protein [Tanacetum cinerariifolium]
IGLTAIVGAKFVIVVRKSSSYEEDVKMPDES